MAYAGGRKEKKSVGPADSDDEKHAEVPPHTTWTPDQVTQVVQSAIDLELYTIPLYLTALASVRPSTGDGDGNDPEIPIEGAAFKVTELLKSVAIQEMMHLQWICNVAAAIGYQFTMAVPDMGPDGMPSAIKFNENVAALLDGFTGCGNAREVINALLAIEHPFDVTPDRVGATEAAVPSDFPGVSVDFQETYDSIGNLYHALATGLTDCFADMYKAAHPPKDGGAAKDEMQQQAYAQENYGFKFEVTTTTEAIGLLLAIVEQGEGAGVQKEIDPGFEPTGNAGADAYTHYDRFQAIAAQWRPETTDPIAIPLYEDGGTDDQAQGDLTRAMQDLLTSIVAAYQGTGPSFADGALGGMYDILRRLRDMWAEGVRPTWTE